MPQLRLPDGTTVALPEGEPIGGALEPRRSPRWSTASCVISPSSRPAM
jgi:hypothetical protein